MDMATVLVYGGGGALGREIVQKFKNDKIYTISVDLTTNDEASQDIKIQGNSMDQDVQTIKTVLDDTKLDALICVAGGWAGGNIATESSLSAVDKMWKFNVQSAICASHVAALHLKEGGLLVLTGASAGLGGTPGMIGYGVAKAATHQLVSSLAAPDSKMPKNSTILAILPVTLDTPANRTAMPTADHSTWTPLKDVAEKLCGWVQHADRPPSGSLIELQTAKGETKWIPVTITVNKHTTNE